MSIKTKNIMSGEHAEVKRKNPFYWPLDLLSGLIHLHIFVLNLPLDQFFLVVAMSVFLVLSFFLVFVLFVAFWFKN